MSHKNRPTISLIALLGLATGGEMYGPETQSGLLGHVSQAEARTGRPLNRSLLPERAAVRSVVAPLAYSIVKSGVITMKRAKNYITPLATALIVSTALIQPAISDTRKAPPDGTDVIMTMYENLRAARYCELFFITGSPDTGLTANFVNSSDLNNADDPKDFCPTEIWNGITPDGLKAEFDVVGIFKNGPRHWTNDWINIPAGPVGNFGGLEARWMGKVNLPKGFGHEGATAYKPTTVARASSMGFAAGEPVFILDDPEGTPWVMQAYTTLVDKDLTYDNLKDLGDRLKLAEGWSFRVAVLDEPLTIQAVDGIARIVQDELQGTYDACFETACSYQP